MFSNHIKVKKEYAESNYFGAFCLAATNRFYGGILMYFPFL
jgi:hypothetical protein